MFKLGRGLKKSFFWKRNLKATGLQPQILQMSLTSVLLTWDVPLRIWSIPKHTTSWPIHRGHVVPDNFLAPECLVRFFTGVLLGDCTAVNLSSLSHTVLSTLLILAVCGTCVTTNSVNMTSLATSLPVAQWLERPTGVMGGHGYDSRRALRIFLCPTLVTNWILHLSQE